MTLLGRRTCPRPPPVRCVLRSRRSPPDAAGDVGSSRSLLQTYVSPLDRRLHSPPLCVPVTPSGTHAACSRPLPPSLSSLPRFPSPPATFAFFLPPPPPVRPCPHPVAPRPFLARTSPFSSLSCSYPRTPPLPARAPVSPPPRSQSLSPLPVHRVPFSPSPPSPPLSHRTARVRPYARHVQLPRSLSKRD